MIQIINYTATHQPDFKRLNVEWIEKYFKVESHDLEQLDQPEKFILAGGGTIFLAQLDEEIVGTVAVIKIEDGSFELAKMAVSPLVHGKGIGKTLCLKAIEHAREQGATKIWLESNTVLSPAITLYKNVGFQEVLIQNTPYSRCNIKMEIIFE
jgi:putative acetyltransferase